MRILTILSSIAVLSSTYVHAQKCRSYNVLTLPATFRDVCVAGSCMSATTFIPDFDLPNDEDNNRAYQETDRIINGYTQNFCAAVSGPGLFPQGCTQCSQQACNYISIDGVARRQVQSVLGADDTPVWRNSNQDTLDRTAGTGIKSIASADTFYKWYHDTPATKRVESSIILTREGHTNTFSMQQPLFFPLDRAGWYDQGDTQEANDRNQHNFGFTTHISSDFVYTGGETFTFQGDDDVWVFIDNTLAIDIGGLHPPVCRTILLDEVVAGGTGKVYDCSVGPFTLKAARPGETYTVPGLAKGSQHTMSIFHAERHKDGSTFAMSTSIGFNVGEVGGLDYTLPSATGARIYIGTYEFISLGRIDSTPDAIQLPIYANAPYDTLIPITLEFPPVDQTIITCRVLQLSPTIVATLKLNQVDRNTITPPLDVTAVKATANQATWASVTVEADHIATSCASNSTDQPSWKITVRTTGAGSGYLYCIAADANGVTYSDYTASGTARDTNFYRKWVATSISSQAPTTPAPTTLPPTTAAPTTLPPTTEAPTTQPPSTAAPTTLAPVITTLPPTTVLPSTAAPTTLSPTTLPPTTMTPTDAATTAPPTTTEPATTQPPTTATTTPTSSVTTAPTTTPAPTTSPTDVVITTAPPTSTPTDGESTNSPTSNPTVTVAPTDATTSTPTPADNSTTSVPTSTAAPTTASTDVPTSTPTSMPGNDSSSSSTGTVNPDISSSSGSGSNNGTTTSVPTTSVITETPPTDEPTDAPVEGAAGVASNAASSGMSTATRLAIIIPAAVGGLIVVLLAVWGIHHCIKKRENAVTNTQRAQMEMV